MIVRQFLSWSQTASAEGRAQGISALARAYLYTKMTITDRADAEIALTAFLDDPSALVRQALAEALADSHAAPRPLVLALAGDETHIAAPLLSRSPVLTDPDLLHLLADADREAQIEIARRQNLCTQACAHIAGTSDYPAVLALVHNTTAHLADRAAQQILHRFDEGELREALLMRPNLSANMRYDLMQATSRALSGFIAHCGWMSPAKLERLTAEAEQNAVIRILTEDKEQDIQSFVAHLCDAGTITPNLLLTSLFTGSLTLLQTALALLAGETPARAIAILQAPESSAFKALYHRAKLPTPLLETFQVALKLRLRLKAERPSPPQIRKMVAYLLKYFDQDQSMPRNLLNFLHHIDAGAAKILAQTMVDHMAEATIEAPAGLEARPDTAPEILIPRLEPAMREPLAAPETHAAPEVRPVALPALAAQQHDQESTAASQSPEADHPVPVIDPDKLTTGNIYANYTIPHIIREYEIYACDLPMQDISTQKRLPAEGSNIYKLDFSKPRAA